MLRTTRRRAHLLIAGLLVSGPLAACERPAPGVKAEPPACGPVDPLIVRLGEVRYRFKQDQVASFGGEDVGAKITDGGRPRRVAYCTRHPEPQVERITLDLRAIRELPARYVTLKKAYVVALDGLKTIQDPAPISSKPSQVDGLTRSGDDDRFSLSAASLPNWDGPVQALCHRTRGDDLVVTKCHLTAEGPAGVRYRIHLEPETLPTTEWGAALAEARDLFESFSSTQP